MLIYRARPVLQKERLVIGYIIVSKDTYCLEPENNTYYGKRVAIAFYGKGEIVYES